MAPPSSSTPKPAMDQVVERNIRPLLARYHQEERQANWQDRLADLITCFTGSMHFVYLRASPP